MANAIADYVAPGGAGHNRQHAITSTADHTSTATPGQLLKADANGLPVNAINTDAQVSAVVTASSTYAIDSTVVHKAGTETITGVKTFDNDTTTEPLSISSAHSLGTGLSINTDTDGANAAIALKRHGVRQASIILSNAEGMGVNSFAIANSDLTTNWVVIPASGILYALVGLTVGPVNNGFNVINIRGSSSVGGGCGIIFKRNDTAIGQLVGYSGDFYFDYQGDMHVRYGYGGSDAAKFGSDGKVYFPQHASVSVLGTNSDGKLVASSDTGSALLARMRFGVELLGTRNHVNLVFTIPGGEKAVPGTLQVYFNGQCVCEGTGNDYEVSESGGPGRGIDTVTFLDAALAPYSGEHVLADFVAVT
jgi:hypothetical protein